jgi:hypothetical protein
MSAALPQTVTPDATRIPRATVSADPLVRCLAWRAVEAGGHWTGTVSDLHALIVATLGHGGPASIGGRCPTVLGKRLTGLPGMSRTPGTRPSEADLETEIDGLVVRRHRERGAGRRWLWSLYIPVMHPEVSAYDPVSPIVRAFVAERLVIDREGIVATGWWADAVRRWAAEHGAVCPSPERLARDLAEIAGERGAVRIREGLRRGWRGIHIVSAEAAALDARAEAAIATALGVADDLDYDRETGGRPASSIPDGLSPTTILDRWWPESVASPPPPVDLPGWRVPAAVAGLMIAAMAIATVSTFFAG